MLTRRVPLTLRSLPQAQRGVVLLVTLIVLVAMILAAIALVRSVDTTNLIAGNLAFKQAATSSADAGVEAAIAWLEAQPAGGLWADNKPNGYSAARQDPGVNETWDFFWTNIINKHPVSQPVATLTCATGGDFACTLPPDAAGNTVTYSISRLCNAVGDPTSTPPKGCAISTVASGNSGSSSQGANEAPLQFTNQIYYRITTRVDGPRNAVSYVQTIIAL